MGTEPDLSRLAWSLDTHGAAGHHRALLRVARLARLAGVSTVLVEILADVEAPEIARLRAFGHVAAELARRRPAETCPAA